MLLVKFEGFVVLLEMFRACLFSQTGLKSGSPIVLICCWSEAITEGISREILSDVRKLTDEPKPYAIKATITTANSLPLFFEFKLSLLMK